MPCALKAHAIRWHIQGKTKTVGWIQFTVRLDRTTSVDNLHIRLNDIGIPGNVIRSNVEIAGMRKQAVYTVNL